MQITSRLTKRHRRDTPWIYYNVPSAPPQIARKFIYLVWEEKLEGIISLKKIVGANAGQ
jgi:hypothetical protein